MADPDYDGLVAQLATQQRATAATAVGYAVNDNPDRAAVNQVLARRYGTTPQVVDAYPDEFRTRALTEAVRSSLDGAPTLEAAINAQPYLAKIIHPEVPQVAQIEKTLAPQGAPAEPGSALENTAGEFAKGLGGAFNKAATGVNLLLGAFPAMYDRVMGTNTADAYFSRMVAPLTSQEGAYQPAQSAPLYAKGFNAAGSLVGMLSQIGLSGTTAAPEAAAEAIPTATEAIGQQVAHGAKAMAFPALSDAVDTGRRVYEQTGDMSAAMRATQMQYVTSTAGGVLPMSAGGGLLSRAAQGAVSGMAGGEVQRQAMNAVMPDAMQSPRDVDNLLIGALTGAVLGGVGPNAHDTGYYDHVRQTYLDAQVAEDAKTDFQRLDALSQTVQAVKWRQSDPEGFAQFMQDVADKSDLKAVYVDAHKLGEIMDGAGLQAEHLMQTMPDVAGQMKEALETNGMVRIPIEDYATHIAGSVVDKPLLQELRTDPEGATYAQAQEYAARAADRWQEMAKAATAAQADQDAFSASQGRVRDTIKAQLDAQGRYPSDVTAIQAEHQSAFLATLAGKLGITPEEAHARFGTNLRSDIGAPGFDQGPAEGAAPDTLDQTARGSYSPETRTISLLRNADLSTFHHEMGHWMLDTYGHVADSPDAPPEIRQDMDRILEWTGIKGDTADDRLANWRGMSLDEQRASHEKFAEGFERYLFEGKAPSIELQSTFQRVRAWMTQIYKTLTNMRVPLTDEVRGVYDRMLASQDAIEQAEAQRVFNPLPKPDAVGTQTWTDYLKQGEQATQDAITQLQNRSLRDMRWLSGATGRVLRRLQVESRSAREEMNMQARREVMSQPVYRAWQFLTSKIDAENKIVPLEAPKSAKGPINPDVDSLFVAIAKAGGLDYDDVVGHWAWGPAEGFPQPMFGKPLLKKNGKGLSIDAMREVLAQHGYFGLDEDGTQDHHWLEKAFSQELSGNKVYSSAVRPEIFLEEVKPGERYNVDALTAGRLDNRSLDILPGLTREEAGAVRAMGMAADYGLHPDLVAEQYGFNSGVELVRALANAEHPSDLINAKTDQHMLAEHGDLATPEAIQRAAEAEIHNEARGRFMATGLKILADAPISPSKLLAGAREAANAAIGAKRIRDLNPRQYAAAEAKANAQAIKRAPTDPAGAVEAQRAALLNNQLAAEAMKARDEVQKAVTYLKRFDKPSVLAKMDPDIRDQVSDLLDRFDLRQNPSRAPTRAEQNLHDWVQAQLDAGYSPNVPPELQNPMVRMPFKDMTVDQMRGLRDTVASMEMLGRERRLVTVDGKRVELADVVGDLKAKMQEEPDRFKAADLVDTPDERAKNPMHAALLKFNAWMRGVATAIRPQQFKANQFDNHQILGPFARAIFERVFDANYRKVDMLKGLSDDFAAHAEALGRDWQDSLHTKVNNQTLLDPDKSAAEGRPVYLELTRAKLLGMALHVGNESNLDKLARGWGWDKGDVMRFLDSHMEAKDWQAVKAVWDLYEKHWPEVDAMNRRLGNTSPDKIQPRPFMTRHGEMPGGYAAIDYDPLRSKRGEIAQAGREIDPGAGLFGRDYFRADSTTNGSLNARKDGYTDRVNLDYGYHAQRMQETIHDLAYREALIDVQKIIEHPEFRQQFRQTYGPESYRAMQEWLGNLANSAAMDRSVTAIQKGLQWTRTGIVINGIGFRVSTVLKHGGSAALKSVGYFAGGGEKYLAYRAAAIGRDLKGEVASARETFPEIRARLLQQDRDYRELSGSLFEPEGKMAKAHRFGHAAVAWSDMLTAVPTAWAAYDRAVGEGLPVNQGGTGKPMSHEDAVRYADRIVREAHGSNIESARSNVIASRNEAIKMLTTLYGFMNNTHGQMMNMLDQIRTPGYSSPEALARGFMAIIAPAVWAGALAYGSPWSDKNKDSGLVPWMGRAIGSELAGTVPLVRDAWSMIEGHEGAGLVGVESWLSTVTKPFEDAYRVWQGRQSKTAIRDTADALGVGLHIPGMGQAGAAAQYAVNVRRGIEQPKNKLEYATGLARGHN